MRQEKYVRDDPELLSLLLHDLEAQPATYRPGPFWRFYAKRMASVIRTEGLAEFRSSAAIGKGFADVAILDPLDLMAGSLRGRVLSLIRKVWPVSNLARSYEQLISKYDRQLDRYRSSYYNAVLADWLEALRQGGELPDSLIAKPARTVTFSFEEIGESYLSPLAWVTEYSTQVDFTGITKVLEIGGGFGAMCHTLLHFYPNIVKYAYIDVPPTLYVGTQYLKSVFGDDVVVDYRKTRLEPDINFSRDDRRQIFALAPWQIEAWTSQCDFFWNSSSFQEMPVESVRNYLRHVSRLSATTSRLGLFLYNDDRHMTLSSHELTRLLREEIAFTVEQLDTKLIDLILAGSSLLARPKTSPDDSVQQ